MRHPKEGSARYASEVSPVPIINAGDVTIDGQNNIFFTGITAEAKEGSTGHGGNLERGLN